MKGKHYEYDGDNGKIIKESKVNCRICWGEEKPCISISMPDKSKRRQVEVLIPLKQFMDIYNRQVDSKKVAKIRECYND